MEFIYKKKTGNWQVQIRRKGFPHVNKNFIDVKTAKSCRNWFRYMAGYNHRKLNF